MARNMRWGLLTLLGLGLAIVPGTIAGASEADVSFDIPAQPLANAIAAFGTVTGFEIIVDASEARGRVSTAVSGELSPLAALSVLLLGTGLTVRQYAPGNVRLTALSDSTAFSPARSPNAPFFAALQQAVATTACTVKVGQPGSYRLALMLWVEPSGAVGRLRLLDTTGDAARDAALGAAFQRLDVGARPPVGMPQPITLVILPKGGEAGCGGNADRERASR